MNATQANTFRSRVKEQLEMEDILIFDIIVRLGWINMFSLEELLNDSHIKYINKISKITLKRLTDCYFGKNQSMYELEHYIPIFNELIKNSRAWESLWILTVGKREEFTRFLQTALLESLFSKF